MDETFLVIDPGALTTVQDLGRFGYQSLGVPVSGGLDSYACRAGNLLVGNPQDAAVLEMTVTGVTLAVLRPAWLAVTGAQAKIKVNSTSKSCWQTFEVAPGDLVRIGQVSRGCRMYLAVGGGIDVPLVMDSRSTSVGSGLGGYKGRPLRKGDVLSVLPHSGHPVTGSIPEELIPNLDTAITLRCIPGPQADFFSASEQTFFASQYTVTGQSDRRGVRLDGPQVTHSHNSPGRVLSEPSLPGNVQVPGDGRPIVLLVEQTVGGYAKIATVISSDLRKLSQATPGSSIHFQPVSLHEAYAARRRQNHRLRKLTTGQ